MPAAVFQPTPAVAYDVCDDDNSCVHEYIADQALTLYTNPEIDAYYADLRDGVEHDDLKDHIYGLSFAFGALVTITHFWDADAGPDDPVENVVGSFPNAWQKVRSLWLLALGAYARGDKPRAYHFLGHVGHLLGDMTLPTHVHDDMHFPDDDAFEDWMSDVDQNPRVRDLTAAEKAQMLLDGPIQIPNVSDKLHWLMYTTNQNADFFASDDYNGDSNDPLGLAADRLAELEATGITSPRTSSQLVDNDDDDDNDDGDLGRIRQESYLRAPRVLAAMYKLFTETVATPITEVVINTVEELEDHDYACFFGCVEISDADFWARVRINGRTSQNRGDEQSGNDTINPGWPFGWNVGSSGTVPIRIEIWDNDGGGSDVVGTGGDDDQSDIAADGDLGIDLNVDLALCLSGADGAVTGDVTGKCGVPLVTAGGNDDEASKVTFTIRVTKPSPTVNTQASPGNLLGAPVRDVANLTGGASPTGDVTFRLYSDIDCATEKFNSTNALSGLTATSGWYTPTVVGTYYWRPTYNGDGNNATSTPACNAPNESVVIKPFEPPPITRTISGDLNGPVTVTADESVLINNARVVGPVTVSPGGALTVVNSQIARGIVANGPDFFSVCGSQISPALPQATGQALSVSNAQVPIRIGDPANGCAGNKWAGTVSLTANLATMMGANTFARNVSVTNSGPGNTTIKGNTAYAALSCTGNNPAPTNGGQANSGPNETGQCAGL